MVSIILQNAISYFNAILHSKKEYKLVNYIVMIFVKESDPTTSKKGLPIVLLAQCEPLKYNKSLSM